MGAGYILLCLVLALGAVIAALIFGVFALLVSDVKMKMLEEPDDLDVKIKKVQSD